MKKISLAVFMVSMVDLLSACGGGGGGGGSTGTQAGQYSVVTAVRYSAPASSCPNGGISVDAGIDRNGNGVLDQSEVTSTQYLCNGTNGLTTLVDTVAEAAGTNCTYGGSKVNVGLDGDSDGVLDTSEITSSDYICNGFPSPETDEPTITKTTPEVGGTGVPVKLAISVIFSEPMDPSTINAETFTLNGDSPVSGTVTYSGLTATFTPSAPLSYSTLYAARISTGAKDLAGNPVGENYTWTFTTGTPGMLDKTFNTTGIVTTSFAAGTSFANSVAIQSDGKIIAAGPVPNGTGGDFGLARYNVDGSPDTTFNTRGIVTTDVDYYDIAQSIAIQSDGKIVAAGYSSNGTRSLIALTRYNPNGTLDTTFNFTGIVTTSFDARDSFANSVAIQSDGKIIVAGSSFGTDSDFALVRYNTDGTLDMTFGTGGKVTTSVGTGEDSAVSVLIQPDGKIVLAGQSLSPNGSNYGFALARYNANGTLDGTFGTGGIVTTVIGPISCANSIAIQSNGMIIAAGESGGSFALARYKTDGTLDGTFGTGGIVTVAGRRSSQSVAIQSNGMIIAAGGTVLVRYNDDGTPDTTFGLNGTTQIGDVQATEVAIQADGRIVVAGSSFTTEYSSYSKYVFALARYIP